ALAPAVVQTPDEVAVLRRTGVLVVQQGPSQSRVAAIHGLDAVQLRGEQTPLRQTLLPLGFLPLPFLLADQSLRAPPLRVGFLTLPLLLGRFVLGGFLSLTSLGPEACGPVRGAGPAAPDQRTRPSRRRSAAQEGDEGVGDRGAGGAPPRGDGGGGAGRG